MVKKIVQGKEKMLMFVAFMFLKVQDVFAENEASGAFNKIDQKLTGAGAQVVNIITWVIGAGLLIGLANAIFKVANKKHESWDNVIGWGAGLVIFIIGMQIIKAVFGFNNG